MECQAFVVDRPLKIRLKSDRFRTQRWQPEPRRIAILQVIHPYLYTNGIGPKARRPVQHRGSVIRESNERGSMSKNTFLWGLATLMLVMITAGMMLPTANAASSTFGTSNVVYKGGDDKCDKSGKGGGSCSTSTT